MVTVNCPSFAKGRQRHRKVTYVCHGVIKICTCNSICVNVFVLLTLYLTVQGLTLWHGWGTGRFGTERNALVWTEKSISALAGWKCSPACVWRTENGSSSPKLRSRPPTPSLQVKPTTISDGKFPVCCSVWVKADLQTVLVTLVRSLYLK